MRACGPSRQRSTSGLWPKAIGRALLRQAPAALTRDGEEPAELWGGVGSKLRSFFLIADVPVTLLNVRYGPRRDILRWMSLEAAD